VGVLFTPVAARVWTFDWFWLVPFEQLIPTRSPMTRLTTIILNPLTPVTYTYLSCCYHHLPPLPRHDRTWFRPRGAFTLLPLPLPVVFRQHTCLITGCLVAPLIPLQALPLSNLGTFRGRRNRYGGAHGTVTVTRFARARLLSPLAWHRRVACWAARGAGVAITAIRHLLSYISASGVAALRSLYICS